MEEISHDLKILRDGSNEGKIRFLKDGHVMGVSKRERGIARGQPKIAKEINVPGENT